MKLSENNYIEQVCVVGTGIPQPIALAVLSDVGKKLPDVNTSIEKTLNHVNQNLECKIVQLNRYQRSSGENPRNGNYCNKT